ncbi:MAG: NAD-dependent epimerase/dehydratase family protein [Pseudomonadota bacterium]|nr:NAD-dependent epimerase/dehydratase family protein [Pseudomonadota bacterium]
MQTTPQTILVTGANGLIGRWLVPALLDQGYRVLAAMRQHESRAAEYQTWVQQHVQQPFHPERLQLCEFRLEQVDTLFSAPDRQHLIAVYHLAAAFHWGLDRRHAHQVNVEAGNRVLELAAALPNLQRFIWIGGYRVAYAPQLDTDGLYKTLGGYEASKQISHQQMKQKANQLQLPWTALHPSSVIGDSRSGETTQFIGAAELVQQLQQGKMPAIPGDRTTFLPLVHVDFVAEFASRLLQYPSSVNQEYWLLDDTTPPLPQLLHRIAHHLQVKAPSRQVPLWLLRRLPAFLLPGSKETLSFLGSDRYDVSNTRQLATEMGIEARLQLGNLEAWVDYLVEHRLQLHTNT